MNVTESQNWLADRTAELELAQGKLASLELQLTAAQESFSRTNGDPAEFVAARDRVAHLEHQIEQCKQAVATCEENCRVARQGLERAQREEKVASLSERASLTNYRAAVAQDVTALLDALIAAEAAARHIDERWGQVERASAELRRFGEPGVNTGLHSRLGPVLLDLLQRHPDQRAMVGDVWKPNSVSGMRPLEDNLNRVGLAGFVSPALLATEPSQGEHVRVQQIAMLTPDQQERARLAEQLRPAPEPKPQATPWRSGTIESFFEGARYKVAVYKSGVAQESYELLPPVDPPPRGVPELSRRNVTVHGLDAVLISYGNGLKAIVPPAKPGIIARAVSAVVDAVTPE
jgi:hypothetical protein